MSQSSVQILHKYSEESHGLNNKIVEIQILPYTWEDTYLVGWQTMGDLQIPYGNQPGQCVCTYD